MSGVDMWCLAGKKDVIRIGTKRVRYGMRRAY